VPELETRLQDRYLRLVEEHLAPVHRVAAGLRALPGAAAAFASTQAAWRFYANGRTDLPALAAPLIAAARDAVAAACADYALVVHDWSFLHLNGHAARADRVALSHSRDLGYELLTSLVVADRDGAPLAPVALQLRAADGVHSTRSRRRLASRSQLDELAPVMRHVEALRLGRPAVHVIDAEADSLAHYRAWHRRGLRLLVRADAQRVARHEGAARRLDAVAATLRRRRGFRFARAVAFEGRPARQYVAEAAVTLDRPARPNRVGAGRRRAVPGPALRLRLVVSEVRSAAGRVLACWYLLTNLPADVPAGRVALWYYFRWRVESYFKLLKTAGLHVEQWQQETAAAVAKRLAVASMAGVVVWHLQRSTAPGAAEARAALVRLSGRQMRRGRPATAPALLAGLWALLQVRWLLEHHDPAELLGWARLALPARDPPEAKSV
jgi:hypothetical protein